ncbi:MAG: HTH-type transcriptional regulator AscG [Candidatus Celerinatantimonas neptuna]|nr:MAG: HTH-type transcriptional regulator AscG [Candidatus Celerinatantimonas neptuna]
MATISDVSRLAKVSKATVSRVLSGNRGVRDDSRDAVLKAVDTLNYRPNVLAQNLASQKVNYVGVVLENCDSDLIGTSLTYLARGIEQQGLDMLVYLAADDAARDQHIERLQSMNAAAILVLGAKNLSISDERIIQIDAAGACQVSFDYQFACESAGRYLLSQGHRQIALWLNDDEAVNESLLSGYRLALQNQSLPFNRQLVLRGDKGSDQPLLELLNRYLPFTALIVRWDSDAASAMRLLREFNIVVPQEVSVMSLEGSALAEQLYPTLTCIQYPLTELINNALAKLSALLHQADDQHERGLLKGRLVIRDSVASITG